MYLIWRVRMLTLNCTTFYVALDKMQCNVTGLNWSTGYQLFHLAWAVWFSGIPICHKHGSFICGDLTTIHKQNWFIWRFDYSAQGLKALSEALQVLVLQDYVHAKRRNTTKRNTHRRSDRQLAGTPESSTSWTSSVGFQHCTPGDAGESKASLLIGGITLNTSLCPFTSWLVTAAQGSGVLPSSTCTVLIWVTYDLCSR